MEQQINPDPVSKAPAKSQETTPKGKKLPDVKALPANAVNRSGHRIRKPLR